MLELNDKQRAELAAGGAVEVENGSYVLLRKDVYERVKSLLDLNPKDFYPAIDQAFKEGWEAPGMEDYDRYEELRP